MLPIQDMKKRLRDQLKFLKRSAEAFDAGCAAEAVRIATVLRVIFHQKGKSTSLLTHLNATNIRIRSSKSVPESSTGAVLLQGWSLATMRMYVSPSRVVLDPIIEPDDRDTMVKWDAWWKASFAAANGINCRRCDLILWVANYDGGAHVDELPERFARFRAVGAFGTFLDSRGVRDIEEAHYVFLRTMACEVLHSPELLELAG
jgi:hypothetical protein